jgi:hypothetical protein
VIVANITRILADVVEQSTAPTSFLDASGDGTANLPRIRGAVTSGDRSIDSSAANSGNLLIERIGRVKLIAIAAREHVGI